MKIGRLAFAFGLLGAYGVAHAGFIYSSATFVGGLVGAYGFENFDGIASGLQSDFTSAAGTHNGFGWTADAPNDIWGLPGAMSTQAATDAITFTFSGNPVTAFGGTFYTTDVNGGFVTGFVTLSLSNGGTVTSHTLSGPAFIGWVADGVNPGTITSAVFTPSSGSNLPAAWATVDDVYTGRALNPVPEPFTLGLGIAGVAAFVRRRVRAKNS